MDDGRWRALAAQQHGVLARRQLPRVGVTRAVMRAQVRAGRWAWRTESVLTTTTGPLAPGQRLWLAVLHCGPGSAIGGLTAAALHGLHGWERPQVTVLVDDDLSFVPVPGLEIVRTRRSIPALRAPGELPVLRVEPAVLLWAGYTEHRRSAQGVLAATVQQRLTTPARLQECLATLRPLRRAREFRAVLADLDGGARSVAEMDVRRACRRFGVLPPHRQRPRVDRGGVRRWTDCEWDLPGGAVLVLEVDGGFHLEVRQYTADVRRQRRLTTPGRMVVRCTALEIRDEPAEVMLDLIALGVPRTPDRRAG